ncbi:RNA polymerase sigma factor [Mahella australiensis]|uniref:RNA polymerase, sigma-24 subunit, ECF subfamily n=1 Tax=Mahella australiensis (strain DSM 15567 / CIP 107919 / 50-1 BON) TaxID=697281 RepID=F4A1K5_MAHA5|nr:RNA polymerase sigma factor [Mahella australiensis]AEE96039.1 RNA polymerase, sigma-24 subunit, ECF subfamily [Mahella australiensis 50-1 BON]
MANKNKSSGVKLFNELMPLIYRELYSFIYAIVRNKAMADDIMQNTMMKAYNKIDDLRDPDKFKAWVFSIAKREAISALRMHERETMTEMLDDNTDYGYDFALPENIILDDEIKTYIANIINDLPPNYREVIILRYWSELSFEEIAKVLNINYNTAKSRHYRAKRIIHAEIVNYLKDESELKGERG